MNQKNQSVDDYIDSFPDAVKKRLKQIRKTILSNAPEAKEEISYSMPSYKIGGKPLMYFAAFKNHIGLYATPSGHMKFSKALSKYKQGKGSVQFPHEETLPLTLIAEIVRFRVKESSKKE